MTDREFTAGLSGLSTSETRVRLGEILAVCRTRACEIGGFQGQGLAEQASLAERKVRLAVQDQIRHLDQCLREYGTPLDEPAPVAEAEPTPEPEVAPVPVEADPPAPQPDPVPAYLPPARGTRPVMPLRPVRVPAPEAGMRITER